LNGLEGINVLTGQKVAIKILGKKLIKEEGLYDKMKREIRILKNQFMHPNIVKVYDFIDTKADLYIICELLTGGELFDYITEKDKISEADCRKWFIQLISALDYVQTSNGITHRDLKPENLLFDDRMNLKIIDFGLCNHTKDGTTLFTGCGSPNYAAPEILMQCGYDGTQVDVWSSGIVLYAMATGKLPFDDEFENTAALFTKIK